MDQARLIPFKRENERNIRLASAISTLAYCCGDDIEYIENQYHLVQANLENVNSNTTA